MRIDYVDLLGMRYLDRTGLGCYWRVAIIDLMN